MIRPKTDDLDPCQAGKCSIFGALIGGLGGILGGLLGGGGASAAANAQAQADEYAANLQMQMFQQVQANEKPFVGAGQNQLAGLTAGLSTGPGGVGTGALNTPFSKQAFKASPGYNFQKQQGQEAILDQQTALGGIPGGNTLKALTTFNQGLANTDYQQQLADYMAQQQQQFGQEFQVAELGSNAGSNQATNASGFGANIGSALAGAGSAKAAGILGTTNSLSTALQALLGGAGGYGGGSTGAGGFYGGGSARVGGGNYGSYG